MHTNRGLERDKGQFYNLLNRLFRQLSELFEEMRAVNQTNNVTPLGFLFTVFLFSIIISSLRDFKKQIILIQSRKDRIIINITGKRKRNPERVILL